MNKILKYNFLPFVSSLLLFAACDYIVNPLLPKSGGMLNASTTVKATDSTGNLKNILVEDYTGEWCENCPAAADELDTLIKTYGSRITPMSVNTGYYAAPSSPLPLPYKNYNYTSATGDVYGGLAGFNVQAFPNGFINRQGALAQNPSPYSIWGSMVAGALSTSGGGDTCFVKLKLSTQFDTISRNLSVTASTTFLKALSGSYKLVVLLTEDSMISPQLRISVGEIPNYAHRYVLHDAINNTWGDSLSNSSTPNQTLTQTFPYTIAAYYPNSNSQPNPTLNTGAIACNYKKCRVVAYIYKANASTTQYPAQYVVLQSLQLKIYP